MISVNTHPNFEVALREHTDMCFAVAFALTKDEQEARSLAEEVIFHAWANGDSLDLSAGLKMALLSMLRAKFLVNLQLSRLTDCDPCGASASRAGALVRN